MQRRRATQLRAADPGIRLLIREGRRRSPSGSSWLLRRVWRVYGVLFRPGSRRLSECSFGCEISLMCASGILLLQAGVTLYDAPPSGNSAHKPHNSRPEMQIRDPPRPIWQPVQGADARRPISRGWPISGPRAYLYAATPSDVDVRNSRVVICFSFTGGFQPYERLASHSRHSRIRFFDDLGWLCFHYYCALRHLLRAKLIAALKSRLLPRRHIRSPTSSQLRYSISRYVAPSLCSFYVLLLSLNF